ncbi:VOC family protein [Kribbella sindirgiensis]|uniref:VOC family protein n=1 Tax=Kribbella sindirgiensis TaxID=1124744 RepID=A0A4R0J8I7_9ACTN|nr:VOC family protein [Kribbella sindirgiensis]TCC42993.1 VOC family protein [Kribbella sindirgiensis]
MLLRHITIDAGNPYKLAQFWSTVTGWPVADGDVPGDDEVLVQAPAPLPGLLFIAVPEGKSVKNRVHLDWSPTERTRDQEVDRILSLGGTIHEDHRVPDGRGWVTMKDPEANEFCVERSEAERAG